MREIRGQVSVGGGGMSQMSQHEVKVTVVLLFLVVFS